MKSDYVKEKRLLKNKGIKIDLLNPAQIHFIASKLKENRNCFEEEDVLLYVKDIAELNFRLCPNGKEWR